MTPISTAIFDKRARALGAQLRSHPDFQAAMPDDSELVWGTFGRTMVARWDRVEGEYRSTHNWPPSVFDIAAAGREGIRLEALRVSRLKWGFHMFVLPGDPIYISEVRAELERLGTSYGFMDLPVPISADVAQVLLLPKDNHQATRVSGVFSREGAVDFGAYLDQVMRRDLIALGERQGSADHDGGTDEPERPRG